MVRLIALDLDGTLLSDDGKVGARNREALLAAEAAGVAVLIATGRRHMYALKVMAGVGLRAETLLVSSNGAVVKSFGSELVARTLMDLETARWLCGVLGEYRNALVITFDRMLDGVDVRGALVVEELSELHGSIGKWMEANAAYIDHVVPIERCLEERAPIQMMLCGTVARMRAAEALLERVGAGERMALHRTEYPEKDLSLVDILPMGCSKGAAVLGLAAGLGIDAADVMAVGDNWNDLSMLEVAGWPVLMGNAPADLLEVAGEKGWRVAGRCEEEGVAEVVLEVLEPVLVEYERG